MEKTINNWSKPQFELPIELSPDDILYLLRYKLEPWQVAEIVGEACHQDNKIYMEVALMVKSINRTEVVG